MIQNCEFIKDCLDGEKCKFKHQVDIGDNYIENMIYTPECFKDKILIKIDKPEFLKK